MAISIALQGDLNIFEAAAQHARLRDVLDSSGEQLLVVDLAAVGEVDSSGLQLLLSAARTAITQGGAMRLEQVPAALRTLMDVAWLDESLAPKKVSARTEERQP